MHKLMSRARYAVAAGRLIHHAWPVIVGAAAALAGALDGLEGALVGFAAGVAASLLWTWVPRAGGRWWRNVLRGHRVVELESVVMPDPTHRDRYRAETRMTLEAVRDRVGILVDGRQWGGRGTVLSTTVSDGGRLIGQALRGKESLYVIDVGPYSRGQQIHYALCETVRCEEGSISPYSEVYIDSVMRKVVLRVVFRAGELPAKEQIRIYGERAELAINRDTNSIELTASRPRVGQTYCMAWHTVAPDQELADGPGGEAATPRAPGTQLYLPPPRHNRLDFHRRDRRSR